MLSALLVLMFNSCMDELTLTVAIFSELFEVMLVAVIV